MSATRLIINHDLEAANERLMLDEIVFWGIHPFQDAWWSASCGQCGWSWNEALHNGEVPTW